MKNDIERLEQRIVALEQDLAVLKSRGLSYRGIRKRSSRSCRGLPLYDIAIGADSARGEMRGHARGIIAIGDIATGLLAVGGVARGFIAFGGVAAGVVLGIGGLSTGLVAVGGLAIGGIALGGVAIGAIAIGGGALGHYAMGGGAIGEYVISSMFRDPEAIRFFDSWLPGLQELLITR